MKDNCESVLPGIMEVIPMLMVTNGKDEERLEGISKLMIFLQIWRQINNEPAFSVSGITMTNSSPHILQQSLKVEGQSHF